MDNWKTGKEILAYCSRCKMDLSAVIVAMVGDQVKKVECKTCRTGRAFKAPRGASEPGKKTVRRPRTVQRKSVAAEWQDLMREHEGKPIRDYNATALFEMGDRVRHPSFGDGVVNQTIHPNKVSIVFENDIKVLIHSLGS